MMQVVPWIGRTVVQNAYVVEDLDAAMARWATVFGVGPFFANRDIRVDEPRYRGEPTELRFAGAIAQAGDVQIELIQQLDDSPSCYRDLYPAGSEGFHHIAVFVDDLDADIARYEALGAPVAFSGVSRGMRFAYVDTSPMLGIMVELLEDVPSVRKAFALVAEAGRTWDGTDPVRGSASAAAAVT
jgi:hypothetical protein